MSRTACGSAATGCAVVVWLNPSICSVCAKALTLSSENGSCEKYAK